MVEMKVANSRKDSSPDYHQMSFMSAGLMDQLNPKHPLLHLAQAIPWGFFESEFSPRVKSLHEVYSTRTVNSDKTNNPQTICA